MNGGRLTSFPTAVRGRAGIFATIVLSRPYRLRFASELLRSVKRTVSIVAASRAQAALICLL